MEKFGLYHTIINSKKSAKEPEKQKNSSPLSTQTEQRENPYLQLLERHKNLSKKIDSLHK